MADAKELAPKKPEREAMKDEASARTCSELQAHFSRTIEYLWRSHIPKGMPVMVNAREGVGKSTICLGIAREILEANPAGLVLWVACEGQLANTLNQADEIGLFQSTRFRVAEFAPGDYLFKFDRPDHLKKFSRLLAQISVESPVLAVFIDSIRGMTSYGDSDSEVGNVMMSVNAAVCDRHGAGLIYIDHWKKGKTEKDNPHSLLDKAVGSTAKTSAVRLVLSVLPVSKFKRSIKEAKNNLGKPAPELEVLKSGGRLIFHEAKWASEQTMKEKAEELLFDLFAERQRIPASEIAEEGEKRGVSFDTIKKVKETLGVDSVKDGERWWWIWDALI
jgi:DNA polymerase III delta prime subunit